MEIKLPEIDQLELEKIKKEKIKELLADDEINSLINELHFDENYLLKNVYYLLKYKQDRDACKNCQGLEMCSKKSNHLQTLLNLDKDKNLFLTYRKCKYEKEVEKIKNKFYARQFENSIFNYKLKNCLDVFAHERLDVIKKYNSFLTGKLSNGIYLYGSSGTGKSFISSVFAVALAKKDTTKSISYIDCSNEMKALERFYGSDFSTFNYYIEEMKIAQFLFLDDLGKEYKSQFVLENILLPVLRYRNEHKLVTFFTSNYSIKYLVNAYSFNKETKLLSQELFQLISSFTDIVELNGMKYTQVK